MKILKKSATVKLPRTKDPANYFRAVLQEGDPALRVKTKNVAKPGLKNTKLLEDLRTLITVCQAHNGQGLAGNQVGINQSIFIKQVGSMVEMFVNPVVTPAPMAKIERAIEGCLSCRDRVEVPRWSRVVVEVSSMDGTRQKLLYTGSQARTIQHEYDHLQGVLITDYIPNGVVKTLV